MSQQHQQHQFSSHNMNEEDEYLAEDEDNEAFFYNNERKASSSSNSSSNFNPNFYNPFEIKHRRRTSRGQFKILEKAFIDNPKPNAKTRQRLAESLSMTPRGVQVWFQNRRAKAKQQQDNNNGSSRKSHDTIVDDLQVSSSTCYSPIVLSSSGMIHSRSQSSSSSSTTYSTKNDIHVISSSAATIITTYNNNSCIPPQIAWYNSSSDAASTVTEEMISSSPLLLTPAQLEQDIVRNDKQDDYCWWMNDVSTIIGNHQTLFNNQAPAAIVVNDTQQLMKTDPFTTATITNAATAAADHHFDAWAYIDSLQINSALSATETATATTMDTSTKSLGNMATYNRHVVDWISSTKAACNIENDLFGILDSNSCNYIPQQQQQQKITKPITTASVDNRRHSYPPMPLEQDESYWAGQQIMRRLSEPNHHPSELELVNSYYFTNNNHYSAINITL